MTPPAADVQEAYDAGQVAGYAAGMAMQLARFTDDERKAALQRSIEETREWLQSPEGRQTVDAALISAADETKALALLKRYQWSAHTHWTQWEIEARELVNRVAGRPAK